MKRLPHLALATLLVTIPALAQNPTQPQSQPPQTSHAPAQRIPRIPPVGPRRAIIVPLPVPVRNPYAPGYVAAKTLPNGHVPPSTANGNFIIGPTHPVAPATQPNPNVPQGRTCTFTMSSAHSRYYPGIARTPGTFGHPDPHNPARLLVPTSHPHPWTRHVWVFIPSQYQPGTAAPFIEDQDGPNPLLFTTVNNLIAQHRIPVMLAIAIQNGGGDAQGSERGLEYDTVSGRYAEFVQNEVLPRVESACHVRLTTNPEGRATMGGSSGAAAAFIMAWFHPEWFRRVLSYSGTYVNQQWPWNPHIPGGAWDLASQFIPKSPRKPIRVWMEVGDRDLYYPNVMRDGMHDWVIANERMAKALAAKGYHYQFVFARNAHHVDYAVQKQTLPEALEYLWHGYPIHHAPAKSK
jgi:predicted alpha/beta superfamily hydrolase